jgi:hypothetical protein
MDTRALGAATVLDTDGAAVPLAAEWADRPVSEVLAALAAARAIPVGA